MVFQEAVLGIHQEGGKEARPYLHLLEVKSVHAKSFEDSMLKMERNIEGFCYMLWYSRMSFSAYPRRLVK